MKHLFTMVLLFTLVASLHAGERKMIQRYNRLTNSWASYPQVTIQDLTFVPPDSLSLADALQNTAPAKWTIQASPHMQHYSPYKGDTVVVTALVVAPAKVITFTQKGWTMLLYDTAASDQWRGILVRCSGDTTSHMLDGFLNPERGQIITMTGVVSEFPTYSMNSTTQFQPIPGIAIDIVGSMPVPPPVTKTVGDFYTGKYSGGKVWYTTGELMEGMVVELTNLTVDAVVNLSRGTFSATDVFGNQISDYDASRYFTFGSLTDHPYGRDPVWNVQFPKVGAVIDTLRGFITTASGSENARGYRICPLYYGDIVFGLVLPAITTHRRYPVIVSPDSTPLVTCKAYAQMQNVNLKNAVLYYSLDNGPFIADTMTYNPTDSSAQTTIPKQPENTFVKYFIEATDDSLNTTILASSATGGGASDTSKGCFFYTVLNRPLTIHDIQYTPFLNGRTSYLGAVVSISGIVTADTASLGRSGKSGWTTVWYMQTGTQPWSGIWITGPDSLMAQIRNGDSITVTGSVTENYDVTQIYNISSVVINSVGNFVPAPIDINTGHFDPTVGNGSPLAEPYEGMLVRLLNVTVTNIYPTFADPSEYEVDDDTGPVIIQQGGKNKYSNIPTDTTFGKTIIHKQDKISYITGIVYYSYNRYKIVPRTDTDFGSITVGVKDMNDNILPAKYGLSQNYPNPFNPTTRFEVNLPQASNLEVTVYNLLGQKVITIVNEHRAAGSYTIAWNGTNSNGMLVNSGVYFLRMQADKFTSVRKVMLLK